MRRRHSTHPRGSDFHLVGRSGTRGHRSLLVCHSLPVTERLAARLAESGGEDVARACSSLDVANLATVVTELDRPAAHGLRRDAVAGDVFEPASKDGALAHAFR